MRLTVDTAIFRALGTMARPVTEQKDDRDDTGRLAQRRTAP